MVSKYDVCERISSLYPQLGSCDGTMQVNWDEANRAWAVDFELEGERLRHYLDPADARACVDKRQCVGMGIEFGQFL